MRIIETFERDEHLRRLTRDNRHAWLCDEEVAHLFKTRPAVNRVIVALRGPPHGVKGSVWPEHATDVVCIVGGRRRRPEYRFGSDAGPSLGQFLGVKRAKATATLAKRGLLQQLAAEILSGHVDLARQTMQVCHDALETEGIEEPGNFDAFDIAQLLRVAIRDFEDQENG